MYRSPKNQNISICSDSVFDSLAYDLVTTRLLEYEAKANKKPTKYKARKGVL